MSTVDEAIDNAALQKALRDERARREARKVLDQEGRGQAPLIRGYRLGEMLLRDIKPRRAVLSRGDQALISQGDITEVFAFRGIGKTLFAQTIAALVAYGGRTLDLHAEEPSRVLYIDGEMREVDIQSRFRMISKGLRINPQMSLAGQDRGGGLTLICADGQDSYLPRVDTVEGQAAIEPYVAEADVVVFDSRSTLFDSEGEKDPTAWQPAQDYLLSLRRQGKTAVLIHHANRQGGARGISKTEDILDTVIKLSRPEDYVASQGARFQVEFEKARGLYGAVAAPFVASFGGEDGWQGEQASRPETPAERLLAYLATAEQVGESPSSASKAITGAGLKKKAGLEAFAELKNRGWIQETDEGWKVVPEEERNGDPVPF